MFRLAIILSIPDRFIIHPIPGLSLWAAHDPNEFNPIISHEGTFLLIFIYKLSENMLRCNLEKTCL